MEQQIRLCILGDPAADTTDLGAVLFGHSDAPEPELYADHEAFCAAVTAAAQAGGTVVAAAAPANYTAAKLRLIKAFNCKAVKSKPILAALEGSGLEGRQADLQSAVPVGAAAYPGPQGKYSAFAFRAGDCRVLFVPADAQVLQALPLDAIRQELPAPKAQTKAQQLADDIRAVVARGKKIAVADTEPAALLLKVILSAPQADTVFLPTEIKAGKKKKAADIHQQARAAKEAAEDAALGVAVSAPQTNADGETFVTVSVADAACAKAANVYAVPGENEQQLATAAVLQVCSMMNELSAADGLTPPTDAAPKKKGMRKSLLVAIIGIAAALILCGVLIFLMGSRSNAIETGSLRTDVAFNDNLGESGTLGDVYNERGESGRPDAEELTHSFFDGISAAIDSRAAATATAPEESESILSGMATTVIQVAANRIPATSSSTAAARAAAAKAPLAGTKAAATAATTAAPGAFVINPPLAATVSTTKGAATTAKATTTAKPTTTTAAPRSTTRIKGGDVDVEKGVTANTVTPDRKVPEGSKGVFVFKAYGWGHGVGMSQQGAIVMARDGRNYAQILQHYYPGTTIETDTATPASVVYGGTEIALIPYLCRSTKAEIGDDSPIEAIKAQMIVIYTFAKYYNFNVGSSLHAYKASYDYKGTRIYDACMEVLGISSEGETPQALYVAYNGKPAATSYFDTAAGKTTSASSVWGNPDSMYPYMTGGVTSPEPVDVSTRTFTAEEMRGYIEAFAAKKGMTINLGSDPATWLEIVEHDASYSSNIGYVTTIRVGDKQMRGDTFRSNLLGYRLRSHCFTFEYIPA